MGAIIRDFGDSSILSGSNCVTSDVWHLCFRDVIDSMSYCELMETLVFS